MISQINIPPLEPLMLSDGLNIVGTNNARAFFTLSQILRGEEDFGICFDENGEVVEKIPTHVLNIGDIAGVYDFDNWFMKSALSRVLTQLDENQLKKLHEVYEIGYEIFDSIALDGMLPIKLGSEFDAKTLLGIYRPKIDVPNPQSFYDVLQAVIDTAGVLNEKRMLVLLHITEYCTQEQLNYLIKDILRQNLRVLSLEWTDHPFRFDNGRSWFIDEDYVQFSGSVQQTSRLSVSDV